MSETTYKVFKAFIASPGDVAAERQLAEETIAKINRAVRDTLGVAIDTRKWEHLPPIAPNLPEEQIQDVLNREVEKCHFFILILNKRYGSAEAGHSISNTEREINTILNAHAKKNPRPRILAYFRELDENGDIGSQEEKVRDLRARLGKLGLPYRTYRDPREFDGYLVHDLYDVLLRIQLSPFKKMALQNFWRMGETSRPHDPLVSIIYPPTERPYVRDGDSEKYWLNRLTTHLAFEDYKAIQKIEKGFHLLGLNRYRVHSQNHLPPELKWVNRIWLCLPRNRPGLKALSEHQERGVVKFSLPSGGARPGTLEWKSENGDIQSVQSPMAQYLELQRNGMDTKGDWNGQLAAVVAKDFAVLARLKRKIAEEEDPLWDYFFAGLRGLGTWGAAWFVDRHYRQFKYKDDDDEIQLLLEVTYSHGRIQSVIDVSTFGQAYFDEQNNTDHIVRSIQEFRGEGV